MATDTGSHVVQLSFGKKLLQDLQSTFKDKKYEYANKIAEDIESTYRSEILETVSKFKTLGRQASATFAFWITFLEGATTLLHLIRAEKDADFELHLHTVSEAIPWLMTAQLCQICTHICSRNEENGRKPFKVICPHEDWDICCMQIFTKQVQWCFYRSSIGTKDQP
jgi:hypothetical protein